MDRNKLERIMEHIIYHIEQGGCNAYDQINAYLLTSDESYITRSGKARDYIQKLDKDMIRKYMKRR